MLTLSTASCPLQSAGAGAAGIPLTDTSWQRESALNLFQTRLKVLLMLWMQISLLETGAGPCQVPVSSPHFSLPFAAAAARFLTAMELTEPYPRGGCREAPDLSVCEEWCRRGGCNARPNGWAHCATAAPKLLRTPGDHEAFGIQLQSSSASVLLRSAEPLWATRRVLLHVRNELCSVGFAGRKGKE